MKDIERIKEYVKARIEYHKGNSELIAVGKTYAYNDVLEFIKVMEEKAKIEVEGGGNEKGI